jgi:dolichol-phosphate mannosyltransferase
MALADADLVIGSRWVPGGSVRNWPLRRELLSRGGNLYVRLLLGIDVRDATAGFRLFRRSALEKIDLSSVQSTGYVFQTDLVTRCLRAGLVVREVPIEFVERVRGDSKMSGAVASESLRRITSWGLRERRDQVRRAVRRQGRSS